MCKRSEHKYYSGYKFNMLTVVGLDCEYPKKKWMCICECGNYVSVYDGNMGKQKSCGCIKASVAYANSRKSITHGETNTRLYRIWGGMRRRCYELKNKDYPNYGGRGIVVCDEWLDYSSFRDWAIDNGYNDSFTLDRIDVNGNYCPENCRWADSVTQCNNRRSNHTYAFNGVEHTIAEWSRIYNIPPKTLRYRLASGWNIESAMTAPVTRSNNSIKNYTNNRLAKVS